MIGNVKVDNKLVLAPMAGVNCTSFRLLCKEYGAGLLYTQMYDVARIIKMDEDEIKGLLNISRKERPVSIQLIGSDQETIADAARLVEKHADIIDLNFGCVLSEWLAKKTGAYFLKNKDRMCKIIEAVVGAVSCPVTVKTRLGWDEVDTTIPRLVAQAGADGLAIHARTRKQGYRGNARAGWHHLKRISDDIDITLIGNGDISQPSHVKGMLDYSGCDMAMIGRAAMDNPYIFRQSLDYLRKGDFRREVSPLDMFRRFFKLYMRYENRQSIDEIRDHAIWFLKNTKQSRRARNELIKAKDADKMMDIMERMGTPYEV